MKEAAAETPIQRLRLAEIMYFGLPPWHTGESGYAKWFFTVEKVLRDQFGLNVGHLELHTSMLDASVGSIPLLGPLYSILLLGIRIRKEEALVHVLSQTHHYYRILELSKKRTKRGQRVRTILTVHDVLNQDGTEMPSIQEKLQHADGLFVPSEHTRKSVLRISSFGGPIFLIPNPVDPRVFRSLPSQLKARERNGVLKHLGLQAGTRLLLYVGSELPRKNIEGLLAMFAHVLRHAESVALLLVSRPSPRRRSLMSLADSMEITANVRWIDHVRDEELVRLYNASHVFVTLSRGEGFCMPVIESMACGTPVVASNQSALPDVVGDSGVLVDPLDPSSVAEVVCSLLDSADTRQRLAERGTRRVLPLRPELVAAKYVDAYATVLDGS